MAIDEKKLIYADDLLKAMEELNHSLQGARYYFAHIENWIRSQPKLDVPDTNVGKWIPCSDRLPEDEGDYLVTCKGRHNRFVEIVQFRFERFMICQDLCEVIAWYDEPLPEAYRGISYERTIK